MKKLLIVLLICMLLLSLASCASETPYIGENGNWWIGDEDLGVAAQGPQGDQGPQGETTVAHFSGKAGDNIIWTFTSDNVLTFSGNGEMWEYYTGSRYQPSILVIPWHSIASMVERVEIEDGITSICRFAFCGLTNLKHVDIPKTACTYA